MANSRAEFLVEILREANEIHYPSKYPSKNMERTFTVKDRNIMIERASENLRHAEHGLRNILQDKTVESEAKEVLKMGEKDKDKYYREVFHSGGNGALKELYRAIDKKKKPTFTIAKTVEAQVKDALELNSEGRQKYYQAVLDSRGQNAVDKLLSAVKKERARTNGIEIGD